MSTSPIQEEVNANQNNERDRAKQHLSWGHLIGDAKDLVPMRSGINQREIRIQEEEENPEKHHGYKDDRSVVIEGQRHPEKHAETEGGKGDDGQRTGSLIIHELRGNRVGEKVNANRENANEPARCRFRQDVAEIAAFKPFFRRLKRQEESAATNGDNLPNIHVVGRKRISKSLIGDPANNHEDQRRQNGKDGLR